jgi:pantothenate kinase
MDKLWNFIGASLINKGSEGSIKCKSHKKDSCPVCILMPNQKNPVKRVGLDIGGSLAKLVYFEPNRPVIPSTPGEDDQEEIAGGSLHFIKFEVATKLDELLQFMQENSLHQTGILKVTGGGAHKYANLFQDKLGVKLEKEDEMRTLIVGLNFLLKNVPNEAFTFSQDINHPNPKTFVPPSANPFPYLLVNIGSGVSIIRVDSESSFERIGGTSLGGGTFWGLCNLLTGLMDFDEMLQFSEKGDNTKVDLLVGDIYGTDYSRIGLASDVIASSFGKIMYSIQKGGSLDLKKEDICLSLLRMISNNIGQVAYLNALRLGLKRIYFGGFFIRGHPYTMAKMSFAINFWSRGGMKAHFLTHEGYLGAVGALISENDDFYSRSREWLEKKKKRFSQFVSDWMGIEVNDKKNKKLKLDCSCGTPFCEGIVCKKDDAHEQLSNSENNPAEDTTQ